MPSISPEEKHWLLFFKRNRIHRPYEMLRSGSQKVQQGAVIGLSVEPTGFHKRRSVRILPHVGGHIVYSGLTRKALHVSAQVEK